MEVKMWHDDVRPLPNDKQDWIWVRTNDEAKELLSTCKVVECSLDHDLGHHYINVEDEEDAIYLKGDSEDDGFQLVKWMIEKNIIPPRITIHSWNPYGAEMMASYLRQYLRITKRIDNHKIVIQPYEATQSN